MHKKHYRRLREEDRQVIYRMSKAGKKQSEIAEDGFELFLNELLRVGHPSSNPSPALAGSRSRPQAS